MRSDFDKGTLYLSDNSREYSLVETASKHAPNAATLLTLLDEQKLSKRQRVVTASILASSLLQLQKTPWSVDGWRNNSIWFVCDKDGKAISDYPYITQAFESTRSVRTSNSNIPTKPTDKGHFDTVLIQFGILLLELCFGETLESRMKKRKWDITDDSDQGALIKYTAALDWSTEVQDEFPDFQTPIDRCLKGAFGERVDWGSPQFIQKVYMNLAKPLSEILDRNGWSGTRH